MFLAALTAAAYAPVRGYAFITYDDPGYVANNPHVQAGLSWETLRWSLTSTEQSNWHPLTWLSHALDCQFFGLDPGAHHITNVVIHVINAILLFLLLEKVTRATGCSFLAAALFALHPFNVDSVAWIAERKNVLSTMLFLLTLFAYGWYARRPEWKRYVLVMMLFVFGLMAKPMLVTLPFVLLLLDYWPLQRIDGWCERSKELSIPQVSWKRLLTEKLPLLALSVASSVVTIVAQRETIRAVPVISYADRLGNAVGSYGLYIWKALWPSGFAFFYPYLFDPTLAVPPGAAAWAAVVTGVFLLTVGSGIVWSQRRRRPYLLTGWAWYLGTLIPVIGIVQVGAQGMADRYAYLPLIGIFIIAAWGLAEVADHFRIRPAWREIFTVAILAVLLFLTARQVRYWRSDYDLWSHTVEVTANNYFADDQVGSLLLAEHRPEALGYFEEAARIAPLDPTSHETLAAYLQDQGRLNEAIRNYEIVVRESNDAKPLVYSYVNLCVIFGELEDYERAHAAFARALQKDPQETTRVIGVLAEAVSARPAAEGYLRLGLLFEQAGQLADARAAYQQALKLNPNRLEVQKAFDHLELTGGRAPALAKSAEKSPAF
ncbi:Tetratricopeptide TPR_2 repeat protein [Acidobacteriia bacterium SbA2]|nr:Tetratricopeptide TPR_2 repeat protein [Acidobacteriia bacterium SbA2]